MTEQIWTKKQLERLTQLQIEYQIPHAIIEGIQKVIEILDTYYGADRKVGDDGGYVLLILPDITERWRSSYLEVLKKYRLKEEDAEFRDLVYEKAGVEWHSDLFLVSNDYGITIVYTRRKEVV